MPPKNKSGKPAPGKSKADILRHNKARKVKHNDRAKNPKSLKEIAATEFAASPNKHKKTKDLISENRSNGQVKKLTTDELAEKLKRNLVIHYVSVEKETDFLILQAEEKNNKLPKSMEDTFKAPVHKKLKAAIQKLAVHAAILADYIDISKVKKASEIDPELYASFNVTSVHFKYGKKGDSIQINATCKTFRDKAFNFTTPIEYLDADSETAYEFTDDLLKIRQNIFDRIDSYMSGEERGDANAIGMFAETEKDEPEETEATIVSDGQEHDVTGRY